MMDKRNLLIDDLNLINTCTNKELKDAVDYLLVRYPNEVDQYLIDDKNLGLAYYVCGYDGDCQQKFIEDIKLSYNVNVF